MHTALESIALFAFASTIACLTACSSEDKNGTSTSATTPAKTCANMQKCCDKASEPTKSACNAAIAGKNESLCASSYDAMCAGSGDGGTEGGAAPEAASDCSASCAKLTSVGCGTDTCQKDCEKSYLQAKSKSCASEWTAYFRCSASATYTCSGGTASTTDCATEATALANCN